jgi:hypothetical protein
VGYQKKTDGLCRACGKQADFSAFRGLDLMNETKARSVITVSMSAFF